MKIKVMEIPVEARTYAFSIPAAVLQAALADRPDLLGPLAADVAVSAYRIESTVYIRGEARLSATVACARCGEENEAGISVRWSRVLSRAKEDRDEIESEGHGYYRGEEVDLTPIAVENIGLALPQILLCDPSCKGLCYICGRNLNIGECGCPR